MKKRILFYLLVTFIVSSTIFVGFTLAASPTGTLTVANTYQPDTMDPIRVDNNIIFYMTLVHDTLVGATPEGELSTDTGIAHKWEMSPDGKVWTFYLRKGIKFHNGDEVTAEDVKFSLNRVISPYGLSTFSPALRKTIERIETLDRYTVRIYCKVPAPLLSYDLSSMSGAEGYVLPKKYIEKHGNTHFAQNPIGTGPYKVVEAVGGYHIKMEAAFDRHWLLGPLKYKNVVFRLIPEELVRVGAIKTGEVDIAYIGPDRVDGLKAAGYTILQDPGTVVPFFTTTEQWNEKHPVHNKKVRQALALAINGEEIFKHIFHGIGRLTGNCNAIRGSMGYKDFPPYPYDPQKAKELLKEAGYPDGFEIKLHSFPAGYWFPTLPRAFELVASYFEKIGVKPKIIPYADYSSFRPKFVGHELEGGIVANASGGRANPLKSMNLWWHGKSLARFAEASELTNMIEKATSTLDEKERIELIQKIAEYTYLNYNTLWSLEFASPYVISKKLEPWELGYLPFDINLRDVVRQ